MSSAQPVPPCREGATPEELRREADRSVLYGACLKVFRPSTRVKPRIAAAVEALVPGVRAVFEGHAGPAAKFARDYAAACGGSAFLEGKASEFQAQQRPRDPETPREPLTHFDS